MELGTIATEDITRSHSGGSCFQIGYSLVKTEKKERVRNRIVIFNGEDVVIDYQRNNFPSYG